MSDFVYILTNPTMPDLVKIGCTSNLEERLRSLSSHSGVPVPFECYYCGEVDNGLEIENRLLKGLGDHRINPKREFLQISPERVKILLEGYSNREVTPGSDIVDSREEQDALDRVRSKRPAFTFPMVNISIGSELTFIRDETITATVVSDREIEFEGKVDKLSPITSEILRTRFGKNMPSVRGPDFWIFDSETLTERRLRLEEKED